MRGINRCTSEVPCALKLKYEDETTSTVNKKYLITKTTTAPLNEILTRDKFETLTTTSTTTLGLRKTTTPETVQSPTTSLIAVASTEALVDEAHEDDTRCSCVNPFAGFAQEFIGLPEVICKYKEYCFVSCNSHCRYVNKEIKSYFEQI